MWICKERAFWLVIRMVLPGRLHEGIGRAQRPISRSSLIGAHTSLTVIPFPQQRYTVLDLANGNALSAAANRKTTPASATSGVINSVLPSIDKDPVFGPTTGSLVPRLLERNRVPQPSGPVRAATEMAVAACSHAYVHPSGDFRLPSLIVPGKTSKPLVHCGEKRYQFSLSKRI